MITSQIDWHSYAVSESVFLFAINTEQDPSGYILHFRQLGAFIIHQDLYFSLEFLGNGYIGCLWILLESLLRLSAQNWAQGSRCQLGLIFAPHKERV